MGIGRGMAGMAILAALAAAGGCAAIGKFAHRRANKAAYAIIEDKNRATLGDTKAPPFTIDEAEDEATRSILERAARLDWTQDGYTTPTTAITLGEALGLAIVNNRDYMTQRESLFAQALGLTETRRDFGPIYTADASAELNRIESGHDTAAGTRVERFGTRGFTTGVSTILATGATVGLNFSHQFIRYLEGRPANPSAANTLTFNAVQPLLNGVGPLVTREPLRQDERDMAYAVRRFRRYQQSFVIDVSSRYYGLLANQDQLVNSARNYQTMKDNLKKLRRYAEGGKSTLTEVDQAQQKVLEGEAQLTRSQNDYSRSLDQFKLFLGLPIDLDIGPDPRELEAIAARGMLRPDMTLKEAADTALERRLDLRNTSDEVDDALRKLKIAEQNFLPTLNASYRYTTTEGEDKDRVQLDFRDNSQQFGLDLGLPTDWTVRRNRYRLAQLAVDQARRDLEQERDSLMLEVRDAWRELDEQRTNYRIQQESVNLAERRVKSTGMLLQMGRATARDLLEAQDTLILSKNAVTSALISHTIQRMRFWNAIERFELDERGMWEEEK